jgi:hypothetical protein
MVNLRLTDAEDYGANQAQVPYLLDEFNHFWEDPFDSTDPTFAECAINRPNKVDADGKSSMILINHFLDVSIGIGSNSILVPDRSAESTTNAATGIGSVGDQANRCAGIWGRYPNVMLVDFFGDGNPLLAAEKMNGLSE